MKENVVQTPLMRQYYKIKSQHPDAILLFRVGDFYETFEEDARKTSEILGIVLTKRANGAASYVDLAGFPYHALDNYLPKLIKAGYRVAICEQLEDPKFAKTIVKRGITEIITPGVNFNDNILEQKKHNFLCAVFFSKNLVGAAFLDVSTGHFYCTENTSQNIKQLISKYFPSEIIYERTQKHFLNEILDSNYYTYPALDWLFVLENAQERLKRQFSTINLKPYGLENKPLATIAAGAILNYVDQTQHSDLSHINSIEFINTENYLILDKFTIRNLEIFNPLFQEGKALIDIIDKTNTPMGARLLKIWLSFPLIDIEKITQRHESIDFFIKNPILFEQITAILSQIQDVERLTSKLASTKITPRELLVLKINLSHFNEIYKLLSENDLYQYLRKLRSQMFELSEVVSLIDKYIFDDPSNTVGAGFVIKNGINEELDSLRAISTTGKDFLTKLRDKLALETKIPSLKISFNKVFGYYIEVTNTHKNRVPENWIRKQTLVNSERYITPELKEYEEKILTATERIETIEKQIYAELLEKLKEYVPKIKITSQIIAELDCLCGFATLAIENNYTKPIIDNSKTIEIKEGRHPVIEKNLPAGQTYIPNDLYLDNDKQQIIILTGPNMAGKSAYLRQNALICLLAQIGSFVPASYAKIGILDRIFTRVGASDNISLGESTFMVEMTEASFILNNLTERSLVIFDELGRGTSTYDGISIAWAIIEFLHQNTPKKPKTLFATHYHELNEMEKLYERIKNYKVSVLEKEDNIIFIRKVVPGASEHSFGIHVAAMAGIPRSIIKRAEEILQKLEQTNSTPEIHKPTADSLANSPIQLKIFQLDDPVLSQIRDLIIKIDINNITPIEALNTLDKIKKLLKK